MIFAVYKPKGMTSYDVVERVKRLTGEKRVGHAGTLDPLAQGVLVIGVGRESTRQLGTIVKKEKEYIATGRLGMTSITDDAEGQKTKSSVKKIPSHDEVRAILQQFVGSIMQTPPVYSAVKIGGKEAYKLARRGVTFFLKPRKAEIKQIKLLRYRWPYLRFRVVTGPGVYIRSLARDLGKKLHVGGYVSDLERTRVGDFTKEKATRFDQLLDVLKHF